MPIAVVILLSVFNFIFKLAVSEFFIGTSRFLTPEIPVPLFNILPLRNRAKIGENLNSRELMALPFFIIPNLRTSC